MIENIQLTARVPEELDGSRFDQIAAVLFQDYSRGRLQQWIKAGDLTVNGETKRAKDRLLVDDVLRLQAELANDSGQEWRAEPVALDIVYEDDSILVINKAAGQVVHPAAGNRSGTLMNGLLHYCPDLQHVPRAGIVHRLDKDTTGLMVVAKTLPAHHRLVRQLQKRAVSRVYQAVVCGVLTAGGIVDEPLGRHPVMRKKRAVTADGKESVTHYRLLSRFRAHTHVQLKLETGRTHQIRVHMAHIRHPLVGDPVYGGRLHIPSGASEELAHQLRTFRRQALHAASLGFLHPDTGEEVSFEAPLPDDMQVLLQVLRNDAESQ
ncbi:23S rRNA pseudouridine(1911/1915/1917) synthase RluD [Pseudohongiella spirulinae]|uniref:Pseudouridine synthase n=1 Tax=Pseudohongiella spirulinae TaxID=1249552 RepID=A0A0S2KF86_9GAMM|nr:23S rRNA pseudouridine(1911/1915/1917) synthase RluD [Pseudohongiella spirulinae]ALO46771.1 Ribosomal large subunit pseudouridine synthase D [Pseudohongiella spirulinae]